MNTAFDKTSILLERFVTLAVILPLTMLATPDQAKWAYVVLGHGHYLCCYFVDSKKHQYLMPPKWVMLYLVILSLTILACLMTGGHFFALIAAPIFISHFIVDDAYLTNEYNTPLKLLVGLPVFITASYQSFGRLLTIDIGLHLHLFAFICLMITGLYFIYKKIKLGFYPVFMMSMGAVLLAFYLMNIKYSLLKLLCFLISAHVMNWYIKIGFKKWQISQNVFWSYIKEMTYINIFVTIFALFALFLPKDNFLMLAFFSLPAFGVWSVMHIITTAEPGRHLFLDRIAPFRLLQRQTS